MTEDTEHLYAVEITCLAFVRAKDAHAAALDALAKDRSAWFDPIATPHLVEEIADIPEHHREHPAVVSVLGHQLERET